MNRAHSQKPRSVRSAPLRLAAVRRNSLPLASPAALVLLGAVAFTALATTPAPLGAPLVCFPIEVDASASLPVASDGERSAGAAVDLAALPARVVEALASSSDPQLHMELLRRTGMANASSDRASRSAQPGAGRPWPDLIDRLERGALLAAAEPVSDAAAARAQLALRFFDLGYALEVGETLGMTLGDGAPFLRKAAELAPDELALRFGVALPLYQDSLMTRDDAIRAPSRRACWVHLSRALETDDARLRRNLVATFGAFLDCTTHEQLVAKARRELGGI